MGSSLKNANFVMERRLRDAVQGDSLACFDLGVAFSTGTAGAGFDLVEAHKWFNLAAIAGNEAAQAARAEIASDMTSREVAVAQRAARDWLGLNRARAA